MKSLTAVSEIDTQILMPCENPQKESFDVESFLGLGFTHHMIIVRKAKSLAERLFYIRQAPANKLKQALPDIEELKKLL